MAGTACAGRLDTSARARVLSAVATTPFQLLDTKSTDRKMTLLHFIALTVKEKYPELANFWHELHFVEKAAAGEGSLFQDNSRRLSRSNTWSISGCCCLLFQSFLLKL